MQETVADLERSKKELEAQIGRKDGDITVSRAKLDYEQTLVGKVQKAIKEHQGRVEALEQELEAERQARSHAEHQRSDLARELESINDRLNQACGATAAQTELNKKRDYEVTRLRKDVEESRIQKDTQIAGMKKKQQDSVTEMTEQINQLSKMKSK
jgi:myosin heavy chain 6/7